MKSNVPNTDTCTCGMSCVVGSFFELFPFIFWIEIFQKERLETIYLVIIWFVSGLWSILQRKYHDLKCQMLLKIMKMPLTNVFWTNAGLIFSLTLISSWLE